MIRTLRLKGFRRYVDETFALEGGVCFVSGRNNAGKTSLFLAVEYALFGTAGGARTPTALMRPGASSMGVELVFVGRDGKTYKLQRMHGKPPRAKSKVVGHFTLKEVAEESERYLLSSDFQDHEEHLARKLVEITGISRRVFELAVHVRQGEIAQILDGDSRLDIALGITAAGTANEEMRSLALLDERAAESLPALVASRAHIADEKRTATAGEKELHAEIAKQKRALEENRRGLGDDAAVRALSESVARIEGPVRALVEAAAELARADRAFVDATSAHGDVDVIDAALAGLAKKRPASSTSPEGADPVELRGDLRGRIARATAELASGAATCHCCGAPLERAKLEPLVVAWRAELAGVDARIAEAGRIHAALDAEERALAGARSAVLAANAARERAAHEADSALAKSRAAIGSAMVARAGGANDNGAALDNGDDDVHASARHAADEHARRRSELEAARMAHAARTAKAEALVEAAENALASAEERLADLNGRAARIEREEARLAVVVDALEKRAARAEELRLLAGAFKALQEELRERASRELADATLRIHRALSVDDELASVRIDPARYQVLVTARDHAAEAPASIAQGGGHRLLLGLAFRLALVERLGPFPFVLLDEPTYGLDEKNRGALLERIAGLKLSPQIVLITHHAMGDVSGHHIAIERPAAEATA